MYPFERFTEASKRTLTQAQTETEINGHSYIGTEHLLLALVQPQQPTVGGEVLRRLHVEIEGVRSGIEVVRTRPGWAVFGFRGAIPTPPVQRVIEIANREAGSAATTRVGTQHLLLALLVEGQDVAAQVLQDLGADLDRVRQEVATLEAEGQIDEDARP